MRERRLVKGLAIFASGVCTYKALMSYRHKKLQEELYSQDEHRDEDQYTEED